MTGVGGYLYSKTNGKFVFTYYFYLLQRGRDRPLPVFSALARNISSHAARRYVNYWKTKTFS